MTERSDPPTPKPTIAQVFEVFIPTGPVHNESDNSNRSVNDLRAAIAAAKSAETKK